MKSTVLGTAFVVVVASSLAATPSFSQTADLRPSSVEPRVFESEWGLVHAIDASGVQVFESWSAYAQSDFFHRHGKRCGAASRASFAGSDATSDCTSSLTNPSAIYAPSVALYRVPVVVHIIMNTSGQGAISDALVQSQIDILNEDFLALPGTNGAPGTDIQVEFYLAGTTRTTNNTWFSDGGTYWSTLAWDTRNYLNIYTNNASGNLGYAYVPNGGGVVGNSFDRVVILWSAFGLNAPIGAPYNKGRTTTHEVGHYLGLYHTFDGGCSGTSGCYSNGDLICDTLPESQPNFGCTQTTCGDPDPTDNYMDYSEDLCMNKFTSDQARRMRCTLESWRPDLAEVGPQLPPGEATNPTPSVGAIGVSTSPTLSWFAASGATSYDVYFGTNPAPGAAEFKGNQTGTSYAPGALATSTTYYWRIDPRNAAGTTGGPVWNFTTGAGGGVAVTLFSDGFESGNLTAGGWTRQNTDASASTAAELTGSFGLRNRRTTWAQKALSTVGFNSIRLQYSRRTTGMDSPENLYVEWYNGSAWSAVETTKSTIWAFRDLALPAGAANNANFRVRFRTNCNSNNETAFVDDVVITGVTN